MEYVVYFILSYKTLFIGSQGELMKRKIGLKLQRRQVWSRGGKIDGLNRYGFRWKWM